MTNSTIKKYKNIESYFKEEFGIKMISWKGITIKGLEAAKKNLLDKEVSELRVLKSDASSLSEWIKTLTILFTVLGLVFTMVAGVITNTNQSYDNIDNSITDAARDMTIEQIKEANVPNLKNKQIANAYDEAAKIKRERTADTYFLTAVMYLVFIIFILICLMYFNFMAKKIFAMNNIINEAIEEKKEILHIVKELKREDDARNKEIEAETAKEKLRIVKLRQERLDMKYKK